MILAVKVVPKSGRNLVKKEEGRIKVYLTQAPSDGLANEQLIKVLAGHFNLKKYQVRIIRGQKSRDKLIELDV